MAMNRGFAVITLLAWVGLVTGEAVGDAGAGQLTGTLVDLSHDYAEDTVFWPTAAGFVLHKVADGVTEKGYYYAANEFSTAEHGGTHLDAPVHFAKGRRSVDEIPLEQLFGDAVVIDVSSEAAADRDFLIDVWHLEAWERDNGRIPEGAIVLLRTGFSARWPDREAYLGTATRGPAAIADLHFPGLHPDAARWLGTVRQVRAVGIDTASIDRGQSTLFESHRVLGAADIPIFENLASLEKLPARGAKVLALPMKIRGGSGAPLRIVAFLP